MKRFWVLFILSIVILACGPATASSPGPAVGDKPPDFSLMVPEDSTLRAYLGLEGKESFILPDIQAEVVIIEIFSMY